MSILNKMINRWVESIREKFLGSKDISYDPQLVLNRALNELGNEFKYVRWFAGTPFVRYKIDTEKNLSYWTLHESVGGPLINVEYDQTDRFSMSIDYIMNLLKVYDDEIGKVHVKIPNVAEACDIKSYYKANGRVIHPFVVNFDDMDNYCGTEYARISKVVNPYEYFFENGKMDWMTIKIDTLDVRPILVQEGINDIFKK